MLSQRVTISSYNLPHDLPVTVFSGGCQVSGGLRRMASAKDLLRATPLPVPSGVAAPVAAGGAEGVTILSVMASGVAVPPRSQPIRLRTASKPAPPRHVS